MLSNLTITEIRNLLDRREVSATELLEFYLQNIKAHNPTLNAFLEVFEEESFKYAREVDMRIAREETPRPFEAIPMACKDNILIKGHIASAGSKILHNYIASYDATVTTRLKDAGALFLGRTNMDEFAMGSSTENSAFGVVRNPHDSDRVPGGSSGGSAAAVAADMCVAALGSDTGGSVRQPAALCGVVGLKPTYGAVSRFGLIALASSLDQVGTFTRSVEDAELIFNVISGKDEMDATTVEIEKKDNKSEVRVIGVPKEYFIDGIDPEVEKAVRLTIEELRSAGYTIREVSLPHTPYCLACYYIILPAEASSNLARFDGMRYGLFEKGEVLRDVYENTRHAGFGKEVRRRILLGTHVLSSGYYDAYYGRAQKVRSLIKRDFLQAFEDVDVLLTPVTPTPAFKIGEKVDDPLSMYLSDIFTVSVNLAGVPAISIPIGQTAIEKLPIGVQLIAPHFREDRLFSLGKKLEDLLR